MPAIGTAIKKIRLASGRGLAEVAKEAGISVPLLSQIETGARSPSAETTHRLAGALKVPAEALLVFTLPDHVTLRGGSVGVSALVRSIEKLERAEQELRSELSRMGGRDFEDT